ARGPRRRGGGDDGPIRLVARDVLAKRPHFSRGRVLQRRDQIRRRILQLIRIVGVDRQHRVPAVDVLYEGGRQPRREFLERVARRVLKPAGEDRLVAPQRLDQPRARAVRGGGDLAHERRRLERRAAV